MEKTKIDSEKKDFDFKYWLAELQEACPDDLGAGEIPDIYIIWDLIEEFKKYCKE